MLIGSMQVELHIPACHSLKEKRYVLKSLVSRIKNSFNVSVAEVGFQEKWQRACIGISIVSNSSRMIDSVLDKICVLIERDDRLEIIDTVKEVL